MGEPTSRVGAPARLYRGPAHLALQTKPKLMQYHQAHSMPHHTQHGRGSGATPWTYAEHDVAQPSHVICCLILMRRPLARSARAPAPVAGGPCKKVVQVRQQVRAGRVAGGSCRRVVVRSINRLIDQLAHKRRLGKVRWPISAHWVRWWHELKSGNRRVQVR